ncbi:MAG: hypothetical protein JNL72_15900 [Flavipsychrobacter sp.]|nr:hypothetical protein [Flavipsychrobacter sp.]
MTTAIVRYTEPLELKEVSFLLEKAQRDKKVYYKIFRVLMIASFVFPFIGSWYRAFEGAPNAFSLGRFFVSTGILLAISFTAMWFAYKVNLGKLQADLRSRTKTVETAHILRKAYMHRNDAYYFYIASPNKMSIQVSNEDYHRLDIGDEVNIEYYTHSKLYLGYF